MNSTETKQADRPQANGSQAGHDRAATGVERRRTRRKAADVRRLLLDAAREVFEANGYGGATTREIARRAGINEVLLFRHFGNKANLFGETVFEPFAQLLRDFHSSEQGSPIGTDPKDRQLFVKRLVALVEENRRLLMVLVAVHAYDRHIGEVPNLEAFFAESIKRVRESNPARTSVIAPHVLDTLVRCAFASVVGATLLDEWIFPNGFPSESARAASLSRFIEFGLYGAPAENEGSA
jgi:AcrR family transcriptional regulator